MILCVDTETDGLYKYGLPFDHPAQPDIVQLSCIVMDDAGGERGTLDLIVRPEDRVIPQESSEIHGITHEMAMRYGVPRVAALAAFNALAGSAERIIGYNVDFDMAVIERAFRLIDRPLRAPSDLVCTMMMAKDELKLPPNFTGGDYKWPKLEETYEHLFGEKMENAHDSLWDVKATIKCYYELKRRGHDDAGPARRPRTSSIANWGDPSRTYGRLNDILVRARNRREELPQWESAFLLDMERRADAQGDQVKMSDRQWQILERIEKELDHGSSTPKDARYRGTAGDRQDDATS